MRKIVSPLLILPRKLHKLTLNSLFAIGASPSWPVCKYHALLVIFPSHFFLMQYINLNRVTKSALPSGRLFRASMVWIAVAYRQPIRNATKYLSFLCINLGIMAPPNYSLRAWTSISMRCVILYNPFQTILSLWSSSHRHLAISTYYMPCSLT
jgi:hypothetical protein